MIKSKNHIILQYIGARIQILRTEQGLSEQQLATFLHISAQTIRDYESAEKEISALMLYQLSQWFELPVSSFFPQPELLECVRM